MDQRKQLGLDHYLLEWDEPASQPTTSLNQLEAPSEHHKLQNSPFRSRSTSKMLSTQGDILQQLLSHIRELQAEFQNLQTAEVVQEKDAQQIAKKQLLKTLKQHNQQNVLLRIEYQQLIRSKQFKDPRHLMDKQSQRDSLQHHSFDQFAEQMESIAYLLPPDHPSHIGHCASHGSSRVNNISNISGKENGGTTRRISEVRKTIMPVTHRGSNQCQSSLKKKRPGVASLESSVHLKKIQAPIIEEPKIESENIFLKYMNLILEEEKTIEQSFLASLKQMTRAQGVPEVTRESDILELQEVYRIIVQSENRISGYLKGVQMYQKEITKVNQESQQIYRLIEEFMDARDKIGEIKNKIASIPLLQQELQHKRSYLQQHGGVSKSVPSTPRGSIPSFSFNQDSSKKQQVASKNSFDCLKLFISLFTQDQQKYNINAECGPLLERIRHIERNYSKSFVVDKRQQKIQLLVDSIRQGRKKFAQIYQIYTERIQLLQEKIRGFQRRN